MNAQMNPDETLEARFHAAMVEVYYRAGHEVGYWANYFNRSVKANGGLATARRMLLPRGEGEIQKGLQILLDAGRPDICVEALVLRPEFAPLFSEAELAEARQRLHAFPDYAFRRPVAPEDNFPEVLPEGRSYAEGAARRVLVNVYERNSAARAACLKVHGRRCQVCGMSFEERYGPIGEGFIHVHHKKPLATMRAGYELDPKDDLAPVCPNCHAMLHTSDPPLAIAELKELMRGSDADRSDP